MLVVLIVCSFMVWKLASWVLSCFSKRKRQVRCRARPKVAMTAIEYTISLLCMAYLGFFLLLKSV